jgi:hypothetical protein
MPPMKEVMMAMVRTVDVGCIVNLYPCFSVELESGVLSIELLDAFIQLAVEQNAFSVDTDVVRRFELKLSPVGSHPHGLALPVSVTTCAKVQIASGRRFQITIADQLNAIARAQLEALAANGEVSVGFNLQSGGADTYDGAGFAQFDLDFDCAVLVRDAQGSVVLRECETAATG